jgi:hypothetical protein
MNEGTSGAGQQRIAFPVRPKGEAEKQRFKNSWKLFKKAAGRTDFGQRSVARHQFKKMVTPVEKWKAVVHLMDVHQVSQRRACDVLRVDRSTVR